MNFLRFAGIAATLGGLCGCAAVPPEPPGAPVANEDQLAIVEVAVAPTKVAEPDYPVAPFTKETLYELMVAELAGYRGQYDIALARYVQVTVDTRDPGVAARATRLAAYLKRNDAALQTAQIWAAEDPENIEAHRHAADQLMKVGDLEGAVHHLEAVKRLGGLADFSMFAYRAASLDEESRDALLQVINRMLEDFPVDEQLIYSKAVLLEQNGRFEETLALANQLLAGKIVDNGADGKKAVDRLTVDRKTVDQLTVNRKAVDQLTVDRKAVDQLNINVVMLKVNALRDLQRLEEALQFLQTALEGLSDDRRLRLIYARMLFEADHLDAARQQYEIVIKQVPSDGDILFALALIAMEQGNDIAARGYLDQMIRWNRRVGEAHFYLGSLAEKVNDVPTAIREYKQAGSGYEYLPAQARIASLLVEEGRVGEARTYLEGERGENPDRFVQLVILEAQLLMERGMDGPVLDLLDRGVNHEPDNIDLLYFRGMTGEKLGRLDILERDLKDIITRDPNNADALNALGYTLADRTERHTEALDLIQRALHIKPNEAAFIDSLGWVMYRLEQFDQAILNLRRALALFQNDEVAAHLGEVLWVVGDTLEANKVWHEALDLKPDSEVLKKVIERFTRP